MATITITCGHCSQAFSTRDRRRKFCSRSCAAKTNRNRLGTGKRPTACPNCGAPLTDRAQRNNVFCGRSCQIDFRYRERVASWLDDPNGRDWTRRRDGGPLTAISVPRFIKRWLIEKHGSTACWRCACDMVNPFTGLSIVQVNHIDGDPLNNHPDNLERLCPNCHALTEFHGKRGRGRPGRYDKR